MKMMSIPIAKQSKHPLVTEGKTNTNTRFFYKQPSCQGSNVKNGLKVRQLAKQPPMLKALMQKFLLDPE